MDSGTPQFSHTVTTSLLLILSCMCTCMYPQLGLWLAYAIS